MFPDNWMSKMNGEQSVLLIEEYFDTYNGGGNKELIVVRIVIRW